MKEETTFGANPGRLLRLLSLGLSEPEEEEDPRVPWDVVAEKPGAEIGRYRLMSVLGEGGMGIIYLAEQIRPIKRQVALKIIKPGMDSRRILARFEIERQTLAHLDHPSIAHMLDGGLTDAGRPYFVMEYVDGLSITKYCDSHHLGIDERLRLFQRVCEALQHAHQRGIIHRDIKPSNVLVTSQHGRMLPKVIDFGVARATGQTHSADTLLTEEGQLVGTPEYMSPEQVDPSPKDVGVQSDVYSLGVLLYVLLTGVLPFDQDRLRDGGVDTVRRLIKEEEPRTPSRKLTSLGPQAEQIARERRTDRIALVRRLHHELEWIPLKAMAKDRRRRYRSAAELADDVQNYLDGAPLMAGPPKTSYRLKKFVQRNRLLVSAGVAAAVALAVGLVASAAMYLRAENALRREAHARAQEQHQVQLTEAVSDFLTDSVIGTVHSYRENGQEITPHAVLDAVAEGLEGQFENEPLIHALIHQRLAMSYEALSDFDAAIRHKEQTYQILRESLGEEHPDAMDALFELGQSYAGRGDNELAAPLIAKAVEGRRRLLGVQHPETLYAMNTLAFVYLSLHRYGDSENVVGQMLETIRHKDRDGGSDAVMNVREFAMFRALHWHFTNGVVAERIVKEWQNPRLALEWMHVLAAAGRQAERHQGKLQYDGLGDKYTITASGLDMYGLCDEFHFAHKMLRGDGSITARIDSIEPVHPWTKAGVMIRPTLSSISAHASVVITPERRVAFQYRTGKIGITHSTHTDANSIDIPHWVRLTRKGNRFAAQHSRDGVHWETVQSSDLNEPSSVEIALDEELYIGLVVTSHDPNRTARANLSNVRATGVVIPQGPFTDSSDITLQTLP